MRFEYLIHVLKLIVFYLNANIGNTCCFTCFHFTAMFLYTYGCTPFMKSDQDHMNVLLKFYYLEQIIIFIFIYIENN